MQADQRGLPDWVRLVEHPIVVRTRYHTDASLDFEGASPHLDGEYREIFVGALSEDVGACRIERAQAVFREVPPNESVIAPETCTPYIDANAFGYYIKNELPMVFVRTSKGDLLPDARVAVKFMRENARQFAATLSILERYAPRIFKSEGYAILKRRYPQLFSDVAQPYASFSNAHMAMRIGCYVKTPPGIATLLGPPINQSSVLPLHTGLMESEWHHSELFLVFDNPAFDGNIFVIEPGTVLAQLYFVAKAANDSSQVVFSKSDLGADSSYRSRSIKVGTDLLNDNKEFILSKMTGVKSVTVACPHCWVSVTAAAEAGVPDDHIQVQDFYPGYKALRAEYRRRLRNQLVEGEEQLHEVEKSIKESSRG